MHRALLLLLAGPWLALAAPGSGEVLPEDVPPSARVELLEGRAFLAGPDGVRELFRAGGDLDVGGAGHLELGAHSRAALRWSATASLIVLGPAVVEWGPVEGSRTLLECRFAELSEAHLEVRRGPVRLAFPGGWSASIESGAGFVRGLSGGGVELHHDAGLPLLIAAPHARAEVRPPWVVLAGAWLRLLPGELHPVVLPGSRARLLDPFARRGSGPSSDALLPAWEGFAWPWEGLAVAQAPPAPADEPPGETGGEPVGEPVDEAGGVSESPLEPLAPARAITEGISIPLGADPTGGFAPRPYTSGGVLRLTPWGVRRFAELE
jgi:hypothetical protein